jgi:phosphohistidine phosphatase
MKTLYLIRHAEAVPRQEELPDSERVLVPKGRKQAKRAGQQLKQHDGRSDLFISSPAQRALETAHVFAHYLGYPVQRIALSEKVYEAEDASELLDLLRGADARVDTALLFGHDPTISNLATLLVTRFTESLPKAAVAGIRFPVDQWAEIAPGQGTLDYLDTPLSKAARARLEKATRREMSELFADYLSRALDLCGADDVPVMRKKVKSAARTLAEELLRTAGRRGFLQRQRARQTLAGTSQEKPA